MDVSFRRQWFIELLVVGLIVLASFSSFVLVGGQVARIDFIVPQSSRHAWQTFDSSFYAWSRSTTVGDQATAGTGTLYYLLQAILIVLLGTDFASKILFIFPLLLSGICMLVLGRKRGWSAQVRLIATVIYMVNPYVQSRLVNGQYAILLAYALLPLVLSAYVRAAESPTFTSIMKAGLMTVFQFLFSSNAQAMVMAFGAMGLYSSLQVVLSLRGRRSELGLMILANIKSFVGTLMIFVALDQFIFVPTIWGFWSGSPLQVTGLEVPIGYLQFESQSATVLNVLRLTGWYGNIFTYSALAPSWAPVPLPPAFDSQLFAWLWMLSTFYVPILAFVALLIPAKDMLDIFTRALSVIALFLAKGLQRPLGAIYGWLFANFPLFVMFRDNTKFLVLLSFSFAILAGQGASRICSLVPSKRRCAGAFLTFIIMIPIIFSSWPAFTGDFQGQIHPFIVPQDTLETQEFLGQHSGDFRTIWLPLRLGTTEATWFNWTDIPMVDPAGNPTSFPNPVVGVNQGQFSATDNFLAFVYATLYENRTSHVGELLDLLNVRFVVLRSDVLDKNGIIPREWETLYRILLSQEDLVFRKQFGSIYIFENKWFSSHISISNHPALVLGDKSAMISLLDVPGLRLAETPMFFVDDVSSTTISQIGSMRPTFVWANKGLDDLTLSLTDERFFIEPSRFAMSSLDVQTDWVRSTSDYLSPMWLAWKSFLEYPYRLLSDMPPRSLAATQGTKPLRIPFHIDQDSQYDVWIRTFHGKEEGALHVVLDNSVDFSLQQRANSDIGLVWSKLGTVRLAPSEHYLVLSNLGRLSTIDRIAVIPTWQYQVAQSVALKFLSSPDAQNLILLRGIDAGPVNNSALIAPQEGESALERDALEVVGDSTLRYDFFLPKSGQYSIAIRSQSPEPMRLSLNDKTFLISGDPALTWIKFGTLYLPVGTNHLTVEVTGRAIIDKVIIYSDDEGQSRNGEIGGLGRDSGSSPSLISYHEVDPTFYTVSFLSPSGSMLVFLERYHPSWLLYNENGDASTPALVFGFANAYFVRGGSYILRFEVQDYVSLGFELSVAAALVLVVLSVVNTRYWRRLRRAAPCPTLSKVI